MAKKPSKKELGRFAAAYFGAVPEKQSKLQAEIRENGVVSEYKNGENQWGTRKSPEVDVYNSMIKNYTSVIKQINDILPDAPPGDDELTAFLKGKGGGRG